MARPATTWLGGLEPRLHSGVCLTLPTIEYGASLRFCPDPPARTYLPHQPIAPPRRDKKGTRRRSTARQAVSGLRGRGSAR